MWGAPIPPARCNSRAIDVQLDRPIKESVAIEELVGSPLPGPGVNSHARELANSVPTWHCRAIYASVTEDLVEVLGAVGSDVAALKHQDCGYVLLHEQLGVDCLPRGFRRQVRRPSVRPPLAFTAPSTGSFVSKTAVHRFDLPVVALALFIHASPPPPLRVSAPGPQTIGSASQGFSDSNMTHSPD